MQQLLDSLLVELQTLVQEKIAPNAEEIDRSGEWPQEGVQALLQAGFGGLVAPVASGGHGLGLQALVQVCEKIAQSCSSTAICFGMHCVGTAVIAAKATPEQMSLYLEPISRGEHLTTLALSEKGTGSHFYLPQATLQPGAKGQFLLNGTKAFVTNGGRADSYVLSTTSPETGDSPGIFSCVVVKEKSPGMSWGEPWQGLGMRGNSSRGLSLENVTVETPSLLGQQGDQSWYVFEVIAPYFLMAMAGCYLGVAAAALNEALDHVGRRSYAHTGNSVGDNPIVQHRIGTLWADVERTRLLVYAAASQSDAGAASALPLILSAKAEVADCAVRVTNEVMTIMGGTAYGQTGKVGRLLRDARAAHVMAPTTDMLRTWAGRAVLGKPLLSDRD